MEKGYKDIGLQYNKLLRKVKEESNEDIEYIDGRVENAYRPVAFPEFVLMPTSNEVTREINEIFGMLTFYLSNFIGGKNIYVAKIRELSSSPKKKHVILVCDRSYNRPYSIISEIPWENVQTRILDSKSYRIPEQDFSFRRRGKGDSMMFSMKERDQYKSTYSYRGNSEAELVLLHDIKKSTKYQYNTNMCLIDALDTFCCSITPKE